MDGALEEFRRVAASVTARPPRITVVSDLTGRPATADELASADYWVRHVRHTVRFADGVGGLAERGVTRFLELGPDATLTALARTCLPEDTTERICLPLQRKDRSEPPPCSPPSRAPTPTASPSTTTASSARPVRPPAGSRCPPTRSPASGTG